MTLLSNVVYLFNRIAQGVILSRILAFTILLSFLMISLHHATHEHNEDVNNQTHCVACESQADNIGIENNSPSDRGQHLSIFSDIFFIKNNLFISKQNLSQVYLRAPPVNLI